MGGGGQRFSTERKKNKKKCKDDQNIIRPEKVRLKFFIVGGFRSNFRADSLILFLILFNFIFYFIYIFIFFKPCQIVSIFIVINYL